MERVQCNQLATRWLAGPPGECCHIGNSALVSAVDMLTCWALSTSSRISHGDGSMLLSSCITSIPVNTAPLLMSKLWSDWEKKLKATHRIGLVPVFSAEDILWRADPQVTITVNSMPTQEGASTYLFHRALPVPQESRCQFSENLKIQES